MRTLVGEVDTCGGGRPWRIPPGSGAGERPQRPHESSAGPHQADMLNALQTTPERRKIPREESGGQTEKRRREQKNLPGLKENQIDGWAIYALLGRVWWFYFSFFFFLF